MKISEKTAKSIDIIVHQVKYLVNDIVKDKKRHDVEMEEIIRKLQQERKLYDTRKNRNIKKLLKLVDEINDVYLDLTEETEDAVHKE